jgi:[ribosomal protein S5]-alanine N-acetyltransferase
MRPDSLYTRRLSLQPVTAADVPALHVLWSAAPLRRHLWDDRVIAPEQTRDIVARSELMFMRDGTGLWAARRTGTEALLGFGGYWQVDGSSRAELLFGIDAEHWHRGYATEVAGALLRYGFDDLGLGDVCASADAPNRASQRVLEKLGFRRLPGDGSAVEFRLHRSQREPDCPV